jgi:hypothetical protein
MDMNHIKLQNISKEQYAVHNSMVLTFLINIKGPNYDVVTQNYIFTDECSHWWYTCMASASFPVFE